MHNKVPHNNAVITPSFTGCEGAPVFDNLQVLHDFDNCVECNRLCYKLVKCNEPEVFICISSEFQNLQAYVGKVISFIYDGEEICTTVEQHLCRNLQKTCDIGDERIEIIECFDDCETCLFIPEPKPYDFAQRTIYPGYNTPACTPEVWDKTKCKWSESLYQQMASSRYGIDFCCDASDQKWHIKNQLINLSAIFDESVCADIIPEPTPPTPPEPECENTCLDFKCDALSAIQLELLIFNGDESAMFGQEFTGYFDTLDPGEQEVVSKLMSCFFTSTYDLCLDVLAEKCINTFLALERILVDCEAQISENIASIEVPGYVSAMYKIYLQWYNTVRKRIAELIKEASGSTLCPTFSFLDSLEVTYTNCEGEVITAKYDTLLYLPGINLAPNTSYVLSNESFDQGELVLNNHMLPLIVKVDCEEEPVEPCLCENIQFYNLHGEMNGMVNYQPCDQAGGEDITVGPNSAVSLCIYNEQYTILEALTLPESDVINTGDACCNGETSPICCKDMYVFGGINGGTITFYPCNTNEQATLSLQSEQWIQIQINLCEPYSLSDNYMFIALNGPIGE